MGGMHDFKPFFGGKIMHATEKIAKNHAYRRKRYRGSLKIMHTAAFDALVKIRDPLHILTYRNDHKSPSSVSNNMSGSTGLLRCAFRPACILC